LQVSYLNETIVTWKQTHSLYMYEVLRYKKLRVHELLSI